MPSAFNKKQKSSNIELAKSMLATKLVRVNRKTGASETLRYDAAHIKKVCKLNNEDCYSIGIKARPQSILKNLNMQQLHDAMRKANRDAKRARKGKAPIAQRQHRQQAAG